MSKDGPFFSVIVPAHNSAGFIRRGLESIRGQEFDDYELIVVCDACTDNTAEVAAEYMTGFGDSISLTDYGRAGMARNTGLDMAIGEWVLFMDDDDWYLPGAFGRIAEELERQKDIDILAYSFEWKHIGIGIQSAKRVYPAVWNKAWRRDFIGETRFPDWIHTDDLAFARELHPLARFGYIPDVLYHYEFMRPGSVSDEIRKGKMGSETIPEKGRDAALSYENWLRRRNFE